uniref:Uncharacterized protein n=1 Tax=Stenotrophomonas maltophilia TaxID=40324 RepID=A0A0A0QYV5_STEMA|nr:hypothetical protein [Stenotrophomonas maltophilia]
MQCQDTVNAKSCLSFSVNLNRWRSAKVLLPYPPQCGIRDLGFSLFQEIASKLFGDRLIFQLHVGRSPIECGVEELQALLIDACL